ncbi:hypothetical protein [Fictibacillus gelatini]|uniref:hypothetical protein n=1 Tax=Fictibacillus gelatini TaxID=225985 RepID=UPI00041DB149|nr:hypothetical protein [Fictibacillus gelatini]
MLDKIKKLLIKGEKNEIDDKYVFVPESEINEELKRNIIELERLSEEWSKVFQKKYANEFESRGKQNLKIWICRDIDGDGIGNLTSEKCLEKEYRSQIAIDYDGPKFDDDFYAHTILLWYYFTGGSKGSGTLYDLSKNDLQTDMEEALKMLLSTKNGPKVREIFLDEEIDEENFVHIISSIYPQECYIYAIIPEDEQELLNHLSNDFIEVNKFPLPRVFPREIGHLGYVNDIHKWYVYEFFLRSTSMDYLVFTNIDVSEHLNKINKKNVNIYKIFEDHKIPHITIGPDGQWLNLVQY